MTRQLAPLDRLIEYIPFQRPGENTIFATIVWDRDEGYFGLWKKYLMRENGRYKSDVYHYGGKFLMGFGEKKEFAETKVIVPKELFAKEYPAWERKWVEFMFSTASKNQCQYRKRRIVAYLIQPFLLLCKFIVNCIITIFLLLCGIRDINFKPLSHLIEEETSKIWQNTAYGRQDKKFNRYREEFESVFVYQRNGKKRPSFFLPLAPICPTVLFIAFYFINLKWHIFPNFSSIVGMVILLTCVLSLSCLVATMLLCIYNLIEKIVDEIFPEKSFEEKLHGYDNDQILICNGDFSTNIKSLPREKQTIYLKFMDFKRQVCKPLPR
ncbi:hypothetical protein KKH38_00645 [Patescibacteria group bacterium]|nr:hypothetical protein [Patescibacteria group bacterium]MBU4601069.1 hypothetical protein [Patescibacteria group bacterium]MCG2698496.1 hypothetical protein [Candidatus Parcubacteria bacterium]MCG2701273.1 hypothetical protein [Candidatus Parcubacteria bacterium]